MLYVLPSSCGAFHSNLHATIWIRKNHNNVRQILKRLQSCWLMFCPPFSYISKQDKDNINQGNYHQTSKYCDKMNGWNIQALWVFVMSYFVSKLLTLVFDIYDIRAKHQLSFSIVDSWQKLLIHAHMAQIQGEIGFLTFEDKENANSNTQIQLLWTLEIWKFLGYWNFKTRIGWIHSRTSNVIPFDTKRIFKYLVFMWHLRDFLTCAFLKVNQDDIFLMKKRTRLSKSPKEQTDTEPWKNQKRAFNYTYF